MAAFELVDENSFDSAEFEEVDEQPKSSGYLPPFVPDGEEESVEIGTPEPDGGDEDFEYTQSIRKRIVDTLVPAGAQMTKDPDTIKVVLATLDSIDKQVFGKRRLKQSDKSLANDAKVAEILEKAQLAAERSGKTLVVAPTRTAGMMDKNRLPIPTVLEGEMSNELSEITADQFFEQMENENPHLRRGEVDED